MAERLTHLDEDGRARMVDVGDKLETQRTAVAAGAVSMCKATLDLARAGNTKKGDVRSVSEIAGIMAAKRTADLIPLCHPLPLSDIKVSVETDDALPGFVVTATAKTRGRTGVEMEALTAVAVAGLALHDMVKAVDPAAVLDAVRVERKEGGKTGLWVRPEGR